MASDKLRKIMIVDDSRLMRKSVSKILGKLYDVIEAEDGKQAWSVLQKDEEIEVVCCDLSMPIMDGFGFLGLVHNAEDERIRNTPVIIVTGQEDTEENRNEIFNQGAVDFVSKPFDSVQLKARIKAHLRQKEAVKKLEEQAATDPVTGLGTREFFTKAGQQKISFARREGHHLITVQMAIDNFQELFMQIGRTGAGVILRKVGEIVSSTARQEDLVSRISLDGFAALLDTRDMPGAISMAERVREKVESISVTYQEKTYPVTVSVGISQVNLDDETDINDLLKNSRAIMLNAQQAGGNRVETNQPPEEAVPVAEPVSEEPAPQSQAAEAMQDSDNRAEAGEAPEATGTEDSEGVTLSVDEALDLIEKGEPEAVAYQIDNLMRRILPILGLYEKVCRRSVREAIARIRSAFD